MKAARFPLPVKLLLLALLAVLAVSGCRIESSVEASGGLYTVDRDFLPPTRK